MSVQYAASLSIAQLSKSSTNVAGNGTAGGGCGGAPLRSPATVVSVQRSPGASASAKAPPAATGTSGWTRKYAETSGCGWPSATTRERTACSAVTPAAPGPVSSNVAASGAAPGGDQTTTVTSRVASSKKETYMAPPVKLPAPAPTRTKRAPGAVACV